jgi:hypothetical protein
MAHARQEIAFGPTSHLGGVLCQLQPALMFNTFGNVDEGD